MRICRRAIVAGVVAFGVGGLASPPASAADTTLTFERTFVQRYVLDRFVPGRSAGDQQLFTAELRHPGGAVVGTDRGFCLTVSDGGAPNAGPFRAQCRQTLQLPEGYVDLQGYFDETAYEAGVRQVLGVTAGTAAYATAHGYATLDRTGPSSSRLVVHLDLTARPRPQTLTLYQTATQSYLNDRGLPGRGAGDERYLRFAVTGDRTGTNHGFCLTVTDGEAVAPNAPPYQEQCQESFVLKDGILAVEGFFDETGYQAGEPQTLAVVGGTAAYDHSHGHATFTRTGPTTSTVVIELDPPCRPLERTYLEQGVQFYQVPDDRNPMARGAGDLLTSTSALVEPDTAARLGTSHAFFLTVSDNADQPPYWAQASQSNRLVPEGGPPDGAARPVIHMGGIFNQTEFEAFVPQVFSINGGTGPYAGAHGQVTVQQVLFPATFRMDVELACDEPAPARAGDRARGGGWLQSATGDKINFGFTATQTAEGPRGELQLSDRGAATKIHIKELTFLGEAGPDCGSVRPGPSALQFDGLGTYNGAPATFRVCVEDRGEPGNSRASPTPDRFVLQCTFGCPYTTRARAPDDLLDGGNLQVRRAGDPSGGTSPSTIVLDPVLLTEALPATPQLFTATVYDGSAEPLAGAPLTLTRSGPAGLETSTAVTDAAGRAVFTTVHAPAGAEYRAVAGRAESNTVEVTPLQR